MQRYIIGRLLLFIPALFGVSVLVFVLMRVVPGDVAQQILAGPTGTNAIDPVAYQQLREKLGLNDSLVTQYAHWVGGVLQFDLGRSLQTNATVWSIIKQRFPLTFEIATLTLVFSLIIAIPVGIISAIRPNGWLDYFMRFLSIGGLALPSFWTSILMLIFMATWFKWSPPLFYSNIWQDPVLNLKRVIWPSLALGYLLSAVVARMVRSTMIEILRQDYIRTAWAKGLQERSVNYHHALVNALLPIVTLVGMQYALLLGGTVVQEQIWNLPGIGGSLFTAIIYRDYPVIQSLVLLFALIILGANLLVDIMYAWLDPRIRYG